MVVFVPMDDSLGSKEVITMMVYGVSALFIGIAAVYFKIKPAKQDDTTEEGVNTDHTQIIWDSRVHSDMLMTC